jgi:thioredoxin 1
MRDGIFEVNSDKFQTEVLESSTPVLVDFWAEWCGPCRAIAPIVDDISVEYAGRLRVAKMDADENQDVLMNYGIMGIPTLILFKDGKEIERIVGMQPRDRIMNKIAGHFASTESED